MLFSVLLERGWVLIVSLYWMLNNRLSPCYLQAIRLYDSWVFDWYSPANWSINLLRILALGLRCKTKFLGLRWFRHIESIEQDWLFCIQPVQYRCKNDLCFYCSGWCLLLAKIWLSWKWRSLCCFSVKNWRVIDHRPTLNHRSSEERETIQHLNLLYSIVKNLKG